MCVLIQIIVLCVIVNVLGANDVEDGLKEQSLLYGIALESENITDCGQKLKIFITDLHRRQKWALNMLDSSGQEDKGYLYVNNFWMGSMSQCRSINLNQNNNFSSPYDVEFFSVLFKHYNTIQIQYRTTNNVHLQVSLCLPKSCSVQEISPIIERTIAKKQLLFLQNYPVELSLLKLKPVAENNDWMQDPWVTFTLSSVLLTLMLTTVGSYLDYHLNKNKTKTNPLSWWSRSILCYSFQSNFKSLFDTNLKGDSLPVLHGLKAWGMCYIVIVHFELYMSMAINNSLSIMRFSGEWYIQLFAKSGHSVDTYFCIAGFLLTYGFCNAHKNKKKYSLVQGIKVFCQMIFYRVIRLLPSYLLTIGLVVSIWRYLDRSYPMYRTLDYAEEMCPKYWWRNLLFITTWYRRHEMCLTWTWYLSSDMQFYILNCAILVLSTKFPKMIFSVLKLIVVYSIVEAGWLTYTMSYRHSLDEMDNEVMYHSFAVRMTPYFVGALAGCYFSKWNGKIPINDKSYLRGWIICVIAFLYVIHGLQHPTQSSQIYISFYVSLSKFLWSSCISWLMMACISGKGGIINKFLSHRCWIPISRVTFGVYFTNLIVINILAYTGEEPMHFAMSHQLSFSLGINALCFFVAIIFSLLFETPFTKLMKLFMSSSKEETKIINNNNNNNNIDFNNNKIKIK